MAKINYRDKQDLEDLLQMGGGYVLDFSDSSLKRFVYDAVGEDISDEKYKTRGTSKANRIRSFWELEPEQKVGNLIYELIMIAKDKPQTRDVLSDLSELPSKGLIDRCFRVANSLKGESAVEHIDAIQAINAEVLPIVWTKIEEVIDRYGSLRRPFREIFSLWPCFKTKRG